MSFKTKLKGVTLINLLLSHLQVVFPSITFVSIAMETLLCLHVLTMCKFLLVEFFYTRNNLFDEINDLFLIVFLGCKINSEPEAQKAY